MARQIQVRVIGNNADLQAFLVALALLKPGGWEPGAITTKPARYTPGQIVARTTITKIRRNGETQ